MASFILSQRTFAVNAGPLFVQHLNYQLRNVEGGGHVCVQARPIALLRCGKEALIGCQYVTMIQDSQLRKQVVNWLAFTARLKAPGVAHFGVATTWKEE